VIFELGSHPLTRGKITTSPANPGTPRLGHGSLRAALSPNGRNLDEVLSCGSMENVSYSLALSLLQILMVIAFVAGAGKSVIWYVKPAIFSSQRLTVLASSTIIEDIDHMRKSGRASLAVYYYDFREDRKKGLRGLLSSILFQLCDQSDSYYNILSTFHWAHRDGTKSPSDDELVACLKDLLKIPGSLPVYLIVDGLDECPSTSSLSSPREQVLSLLEDLIAARFTNLRICVTSRPEADIKPVLEPLTFRSVSLHEESGQNLDIEDYIKWVVNTNKNMQRWKLEHKQLVIDVLIERADGM